ncbi:MAG: hypothetical protein ACYDA0_06260 [Candidatus Dormibacteraceae bacterium]
MREAADLVPAAEAVVRACEQPGSKGTEPAREAGRLVSAFLRLSLETESLAVAGGIKTRAVQLLNYHLELIAQAALMAYGHQSERTRRAIGSGGLGPLAQELVDLAQELASMPVPPARTPSRDHPTSSAEVR